MEIRARDSCGARVSDLELERGEAVESQGRVYCVPCAERLGVEPEEDRSHQGRAQKRRAVRAPRAGGRRSNR